jgi:hypothetical protein
LDTLTWIEELPEKERSAAREALKQANTDAEMDAAFREWHPRGYLNSRPVRNLEEFFRCVREATLEGSWFRGDYQDHEHLVPRLYRSPKQGRDLLEVEREFLAEFRRRARPITSTISHDDVWSWYFLIQHYGGPTRLLDWTQAPTIALYFAVQPEIGHADPAVTVLQCKALLQHAHVELGQDTESLRGTVLHPGEGGSSKWISNLSGSGGLDGLPKTPIALLPPHADPRIIAQKSCFTLFGREVNGFSIDGHELKCPCCSRRIITRITIDRTCKASIRRELSRIGITEGTVFPGLAGLCADIQQEFAIQ